ncbi:MAG TPA: hypothetical protein VNL69_05920 [Bacteroidota bacterium]|nr:hypothetical protein [Bacteroidota bacterium]
MTVTILAAIFLAFLVLLAIIGFKAATRKPISPEELAMEKCSICRSKFNKTLLIERQVGDYRLLYFCPSCIKSLHDELVSRN